MYAVLWCRQRYGYNPNILKRCLKSTLNFESGREGEIERERGKKSREDEQKARMHSRIKFVILFMADRYGAYHTNVCESWLTCDWWAETLALDG